MSHVQSDDDGCRRCTRPQLAIAFDPLSNLLGSTNTPHSNSYRPSTRLETLQLAGTLPPTPTPPLNIPSSNNVSVKNDIPRTTPPFHDTMGSMDPKRHRENSNGEPDIFTPPTTPASAAGKKEIDTAAPPPAFHLENLSTDADETALLTLSEAYELDDAVHPTKLGSGAWSNVYKGVLSTSRTVVAVKRPLNAFAKPAVRREAEILSYVQRRVSLSGKVLSIIPFHGLDVATGSIVLTALSGENLDAFARAAATTQSRTTTLTARRQPVVGVPQFLYICERLVGAFTFLKSVGVIHGDVKPQNILTRPAFPHHTSGGSNGGSTWLTDEEKVGLIEPVVSDFSSSYHVDPATGAISDDEDAITGVTTIYCAPELLAAFLLTPPTTPTKPATSLSSLPRSARTPPRPLPSFASDSYGLAMTLLHTALGSHPYAAARVEMQRNMWVRQGDPLSFARADERGVKVRVGGVVERLLRGCFGKTAEGRVGVDGIKGRVGELVGEWRVRRTSGVDGWV
ncbi:Serine/threonine-protein kinase [Drechslerella dactyloides]|uniref:Serine/threonine-protein kinase n=1 Tax=Drechslerella dactyloides TaxID=74499 RepID=A0AAD6IUG5_DREDA|nr:Serine/threonine-protein kinase [Drechslerella dactyloides]